MITLDPDFQCYDIVTVTDRDRFTFQYDEEPGQLQGDVQAVHCFDYSELRGTFEARRLEGNTWEAVRKTI